MASQFVYNLSSLVKILTPSVLTRARTESKITKFLASLDSKAYEGFASRLRLYHRVCAPFSIAPLSDTAPSTYERLGTYPPHYGSIKESYKWRRFSTYHYDMRSYARYFDENLKVYYGFGDVNYYFTQPSITKSRPISESNQNSIVLKLGQNRHFTFIKDPYTFSEKQDRIFFRGACYQEHRSRFLEQFFDAPFCDIGHTGSKSVHTQYLKPKVSIAKHLPYKFLLSLEGNDVASNLKWVLSSNSLCMMPRPKYETWFMESTLLPNVHYCEIAEDYSDVEEKFRFFCANPKAAQEIIHNAHRFCEQFYDTNAEEALNILVLRKYFYLSGQIDITKQERDFFGL